MSGDPEQARPTPRVVVQFSHGHRRYAPLERLEVRYDADGLGGEPLRAIEHSVLWFTEGKGEEDMGVLFFDRIVDRDRLSSESLAGRFACVLPRSPLSYEGVIVKIRWCIRIRFFFAGGRDYVSEHEFVVGQIPPARPLAVGP